jgi:hypothetical protein
MKEEERSSFSITPECVKDLDPNLLFKSTEDAGVDLLYDDTKPLTVDVELHKLNKVENMYND